VCVVALSRLDCAQVAEERLRGIVRELDPEADLDEYNVRGGAGGGGGKLPPPPLLTRPLGESARPLAHSPAGLRSRAASC
jgi:hypothetical protein